MYRLGQASLEFPNLIEGSNPVGGDIFCFSCLFAASVSSQWESYFEVSETVHCDNFILLRVLHRHQFYGVSIPMIACVWSYPDISSMLTVCQCLPVSDTHTSDVECHYNNTYLCMILPRHQLYWVIIPMITCVPRHKL